MYCPQCGDQRDQQDKFCDQCGFKFESENQELLKTDPTRLATLYVVTFTFYGLYWMYRNWRMIAKHEKRNMLSFIRMILCPFFIDDLFRRMTYSQVEQRYLSSVHPGVLSVGFVLNYLLMSAMLTLLLDWELSWGFLWLAFCVCSAWPLYVVQKSINTRQVHGPNTPMLIWDWIIIVLGAAIFTVMIYGSTSISAI